MFSHAPLSHVTPQVVGTLRAAILEEIDFKLEAERTEQFATFLSRSPELTGVVTVPKVYRSASATRILTLERLYGVPLADLESVRKYQPNPELALILALNTWVSSVLTNEWFHADVHAGNLLVLTDGRVAFIDFGIVGAIPRTTAEAMLELVQAFPSGDMVGVGRALEQMGFTKELSDEQRLSFANDIGEVFSSIDSMAADIVTTANAGAAAASVDETQLNRAVSAVAKVAEGYGIRFPREFALLIKQVLYFDRYTQLLAPGLDVLNDDRLSMNRPTPGSEAAPADAKLGSGNRQWDATYSATVASGASEKAATAAADAFVAANEGGATFQEAQQAARQAATAVQTPVVIDIE